MKFIEHYFTKNPMLVEIHRYWRKNFSIGAGGRIIATWLLILFIVATLCYVVSNTGFEPIFYIELFLVCFLIPGILYGSIAGERERRSWDFLLASPVSHGQIIVGKFLAGVSAMGLIVCLGLFVAVFSNAQTFGEDAFSRFMLSQLIVITWGIYLAALTVFFSARCRRALGALGTVLALQFFFSVVAPAFLSVSGAIEINIILKIFQPFTLLVNLSSMRYSSTNYSEQLINPQADILVACVFHILLTIGFLYWTERTLRFADNDVTFLPRKRNA